MTMAIDRNARAKLGAKLRSDAKLTPTTRLVGQAILFAAMNASTGRSLAFRGYLAEEAGCSERSVTRANAALVEAGYLTIVPTWGKNKIAHDGRWFRPRGPNVYEWVVPESFYRANLSTCPRPIYIKKELPPLDPELEAILIRLGTTMVERVELENRQLAASLGATG
jgi:hypothetical protein